MEGDEGQAIAAKLGLHASGATRDLKAARIEREYPALAAILARPSEAPVSFYNDLRDHADRQAAPDKAMATMVATAARLAKNGKRFAPPQAKQALGMSPAAAVVTAKPTDLGDVGEKRSATCEQVAPGKLRIVVTVNALAGQFDTNAAAVARWLVAAGTIEGPGS